MSLVGQNMIAGENFVVEGSNSDDCKESDLKQFIVYCRGALNLRKLNAEDQSDRAKEGLLPQDGRQKNGHRLNGLLNEQEEQLALLLKKLLAQLMD